MANSLTGSTLLTKGDLLHFSNSGSGVTSSLQTIYDGAGTATSVALSSTGASVGNVSLSGNTITSTTGAITLNSASGTLSIGTGSSNTLAIGNGASSTLTIGTGSGSTLTIGNSSGTVTINGTVSFGGALSFTNLTLSGTLTAGTVAATSLTVNSKAVTLGGAFTTSGAYAATLTLTGATNVTLPTTGTLVPTTGTGASGTWSISVSGNAATVTTNANLTGDVTSSGNAATLANSTVTAAKVAANSGAGIPVQVVFGSMTGTATFATSTFINTSLAASITPTASTSKILIHAILHVSINSADLGYAQIVRGSTAIGVGDVAGNRTRCGASAFAMGNNAMYPVHLYWVDSPATTSSTTYTIQACSNNGNTCYINQTQTDSNTTGYPRVVSTITLTEIK